MVGYGIVRIMGNEALTVTDLEMAATADEEITPMHTPETPPIVIQGPISRAQA
jgi:hypothetical protein